ncbi:MAG TPA: glycoside hydrolase family 38 C-terminal domain-containing protein [Ilumatobacteraceae bacterium]|nr:glycoside hydrolase family 38 C-terminal domain-containing protein [Ilumatobacteraceae bacterium]
MHNDRDLVEKRIQRELWERILPLVHVDRRPLTIEAGPDLDHLEPFEAGSSWGAPWATTWFRLSGEIPPEWAGRRVEAVIDLGFHQRAAGFQCEGLLVDVGADGSFRPLQGIHPRRTNYAVDAVVGPLVLHLEAASNPMFPSYTPSHLGSLDTAGDRLLYRLREASLVVVDSEVEALAYDLEVLDGVMRTLHLDDPRRARLQRVLADALDRTTDVDAARRTLAAALAEDFGDAVRHRAVAIGHAHIDTAWLWPLRETKRKVTRTFASAVALMDDYPEYMFCASSAQHYTWIEERHPELFTKIGERVERGQWIPVGGMWVEADMNLPSGESLVRQIVFGQRYFEEKFGVRCTEVWIPDVFGYPAGLPQVFAAGGMDRFVTQKLSWNKQNKFPHSTFWWEGLDGTKVLTHFPPVDTYNAEITPAEFGFSVTNFRDHAWSTDSLMPFGHGDGGGGPTREMLERARRLAHIDARATLEVGTPAAMFDRIEHDAERGAPTPVWRGELYFETHRGTLTSQLKTKLGNRRCERLLVEAELWAATLGRSADVDHLWKDVLTQQFHDILPGSSIAWVHQDAEAVFAEVEAELDDRIAGLLGELGGGGGVIVANRSDSAVDEVVVVGSTIAADAGVDGQQLADGTTAVRLAAPALGVAPFAALPVDDRVVLSDSSMTNHHLAVRWDPFGNITSIIDLAHTREIVPSGELAAVLELAPDHPVEYDAWDLELWTRAGARSLTDSAEVTILDSGPLVGRVQVERHFGPSSSIVTYELRADSPQLIIHVELDWHHDEHLLSMAFPLDVRADVAMCDVQFGVVARPTHPSSPWDAAKFEVCAHRYVDVAEPDFGVAILNTGRYGHSVFNGAVRVSLARAANYPDPRADRGHHDVTLAIRPHGVGLADVRAAAARFNSPLQVLTGTGDRTGAVASTPVVVVSGPDGGAAPGVEVDAVKLADDGTGDLIVRLHEACGNRIRISVATPQRVAAAWQCDLLEEPHTGEEVGDGIVAFTLRPFQIVTLRLRRSATTDGRSLTD